MHDFQSKLLSVFFGLKKRFRLRVWNLVVTDFRPTLVRFNLSNLVLVRAWT